MNSTDPTAMTAADVGFDAAFIGYGAHDQEQPTTPPPVQTAVVQPPPDRISRFRDWVHHEFSAKEIFILDDAGAVIFDDSRHGRLHFLARSVVLTSRRTGGSPEHVRVNIGVGSTLEIVPVQTTHRSLVLGAVFPVALDAASRARLIEALIQATSPAAEG